VNYCQYRILLGPLRSVIESGPDFRVTPKVFDTRRQNVSSAPAWICPAPQQIGYPQLAHRLPPAHHGLAGITGSENLKSIDR
jgi:hypothetical protein